MKQLTSRQKEILDYIDSFYSSHGFSPTYREIMKAFKLSSLGSVFKHIKSLEAKGFIKKGEQKWRAALPVEHGPKQEENETAPATSIAKTITIIGSISKGAKIELFAQVDTLIFPAFLLPTDHACYAFIAKDDTFADQAIKQGDVVAVCLKTSAKNGDVMLATTKKDEAFIGRYFKEKKIVRLDTLSFEEDDIRLRGTLIAVLRTYTIST